MLTLKINNNIITEIKNKMLSILSKFFLIDFKNKKKFRNIKELIIIIIVEIFIFNIARINIIFEKNRTFRVLLSKILVLKFTNFKTKNFLKGMAITKKNNKVESNKLTYSIIFF